MLIHGKKALITGSSRGIGLGVAQAYLAQGAQIGMTSERPLSECPEVQELLKRYPESFYVQANVMQPGEPERLVAEAYRQLGSMDLLVNNVGTYREPAFIDVTRLDFDWIFGLNVWVPMVITREFVRHNLSAKRGGRILFTTSLNGSRSEPLHALYDSSKGAINALTRQLAIELAPFGFSTIAIAPGLVETPLTDFGLRSDPAARRAIEEQIPLRKISTVEDLAMWYVFLGSDYASYATGTIVTIDGGLDAQQMPLRPITEEERQRK